MSPSLRSSLHALALLSSARLAVAAPFEGRLSIDVPAGRAWIDARCLIGHQMCRSVRTITTTFPLDPQRPREVERSTSYSACRQDELVSGRIDLSGVEELAFDAEHQDWLLRSRRVLYVESGETERSVRSMSGPFWARLPGAVLTLRLVWRGAPITVDLLPTREPARALARELHKTHVPHHLRPCSHAPELDNWALYKPGFATAEQRTRCVSVSAR
jgi:hypothetical protein